MRLTTIPRLVLAAALVLSFSATALANTATSEVSGQVTALIAATGTTPAQATVTEGSGQTVTFALTSATVYTLAAPGLGQNGPALAALDLAVGQEITALLPVVSAGILPQAGQVWIDGKVIGGEVTSVTSKSPLSFSLASGGATTGVTVASGASVTPAAAQVTVGSYLVVYGLPTGFGSLTAYAVFIGTGYPEITGTISGSSGNPPVLSVASFGGNLNLPTLASTIFLVGSQRTDSAYIQPGAELTAALTASASGLSASVVSLIPTTLTGTYISRAVSGTATVLNLSANSQTYQVVILPETQLLSSLSVSSLTAGESLTAMGVLSGQTLTAVSLSAGTGTPPPAGQFEVSGAVASLGMGSFTLNTANSGLTLAITSATTFRVGPYSAGVGSFAPGETADVTYQNTSSGDVAISVDITPQTLTGKVSAVSTPATFTLTTPEGRSIAVTLTTNVSYSGPTPLAVGDQVDAQGVLLPEGFLAFAVTVKFAPPPPGTRLTGIVTAASATSVTLSPRQGTTVTLVLTTNTQVRIGPLAVPIDLLAPGEHIGVVVVPASNGQGEEDVSYIDLHPGVVAGTIQAVDRTGSVVTLTVERPGRGMDDWTLRPDVARHDGRNHRPWATLHAVHVILEPGSQVQALGQQGSTVDAFDLLVGMRVVAIGSWSARGLMAAWVRVLPGHSGHGHGRKGHDE